MVSMVGRGRLRKWKAAARAFAQFPRRRHGRSAEHARTLRVHRAAANRQAAAPFGRPEFGRRSAAGPTQDRRQNSQPTRVDRASTGRPAAG